jgi:hypothetical protein
MYTTVEKDRMGSLINYVWLKYVWQVFCCQIWSYHFLYVIIFFFCYVRWDMFDLIHELKDPGCIKGLQGPSSSSMVCFQQNNGVSYLIRTLVRIELISTNSARYKQTYNEHTMYPKGNLHQLHQWRAGGVAVRQTRTVELNKQRERGKGCTLAWSVGPAATVEGVRPIWLLGSRCNVRIW